MTHFNVDVWIWLEEFLTTSDFNFALVFCMLYFVFRSLSLRFVLRYVRLFEHFQIFNDVWNSAVIILGHHYCQWRTVHSALVLVSILVLRGGFTFGFGTISTLPSLDECLHEWPLVYLSVVQSILAVMIGPRFWSLWQPSKCAGYLKHLIVHFVKFCQMSFVGTVFAKHQLNLFASLRSTLEVVGGETIVPVP